jgi:SAM-dependent methyltransferase
MDLPLRLDERNKQPEIMDRPDLPADAHQHALRSLALINWFSGSDAILWTAIKRLALDKRGQRLRVLDVGTGGGDVPIRLQRRARRAGLPIDFVGVDLSPTAIAHAQQKRGGVEFCVLDARQPLPDDCDVIISSLFLHHLETDEAIDILRRMRDAALSAVLVSDLIRSRPGYWLAWLATRILSTSKIVHVDGPRSVEGAFTMPEALAMAERAGLHGATVTWRWPYRYLLQWRRPA